jgi:HSP20 family molecular chaperone IbpA
MRMKSDRQFGWMWAQALDLLDQAERLQRQYVRYVGPGTDSAVWEPPVDIQESGSEVLLQFAIPGVEPGRIEVSLDAEGLTVSAVRPVRLAQRNALVRRLEIPYGRFVRRIPLVGAPLRIVESVYVNGCLEVRLAKAAQNPTRE